MDYFSFIIIRILKLIKNLNSKIIFLFYEIHIRIAKSTLFTVEVNDNYLFEVLNFRECLCCISISLTFLAPLLFLSDFTFPVFNCLWCCFLLHILMK